MTKGKSVKRIAVVAPSCPLHREAAKRITELAASREGCELIIHPQCYLENGHFAGPDEARLAALREVMADPSIDSIWFARGGYGANRIAEAAARDLPAAARSKHYLGYSDSGFLLAGFYKAGLDVAHGPLAQDVLRDGGDAAVERALDWLLDRSPASLEPQLEGPAFAFNLTVLAMLLDTPLEPDLSGAELLVEEVSEHHYEVDRLMFRVTASPNVRSVRRLRLGRVLNVPQNDRDFGSDEEAIVRDWCARSGIRFGGRADIAHDARNRVVPFGFSTS